MDYSAVLLYLTCVFGVLVIPTIVLGGATIVKKWQGLDLRFSILHQKLNNQISYDYISVISFTIKHSINLVLIWVLNGLLVAGKVEDLFAHCMSGL